MLIVTELFNTSVNDFDAKKSVLCSRVIVVTELIVSRTQCTYSCVTLMFVNDFYRNSNAIKIGLFKRDIYFQNF